MYAIAGLDEPPVDLRVFRAVVDLMDGVLEPGPDRKGARRIANLSLGADPILKPRKRVAEYAVEEHRPLEGDGLRRLRLEPAGDDHRDDEGRRKRAASAHERPRFTDRRAVDRRWIPETAWRG